MARSFIFVLLICAFDNEGKWGRLAAFFCIQIYYIAYVAIVRPFTNWKELTLELLNSGMFLLALLCLFFLDSNKRWTNSVKHMYLWYIVLTAILNLIITIIYFCLEIAKRVLGLQDKEKEENFDPVVATQKQDIEDVAVVSENDEFKEQQDEDDNNAAETPDVLTKKSSSNHDSGKRLNEGYPHSKKDKSRQERSAVFQSEFSDNR